MALGKCPQCDAGGINIVMLHNMGLDIGKWSPPTRLEHKNLDNDRSTHVITKLHTEPNSALHYSKGSVLQLK